MVFRDTGCELHVARQAHGVLRLEPRGESWCRPDRGDETEADE